MKQKICSKNHNKGAKTYVICVVSFFLHQTFDFQEYTLGNFFFQSDLLGVSARI